MKESSITSPIKDASKIDRSKKKVRKNITATVVLTSLVDAFSILVIYLLVSFSNSGEILYLSKDMQLPTALQAETLEKKTLVKIEKQEYYIEETKVPVKSLVEKLVSVRQELADLKILDEDIALTIQADRRVTYELINNVVRAGGHAGFSNIQFAVLAK